MLPQLDDLALQALHDRWGGSKLFLLGLIHDALRSGDHMRAHCAFPTTAAVCFEGGIIMHLQLALPP